MFQTGTVSKECPLQAEQSGPVTMELNHPDNRLGIFMTPDRFLRKNALCVEADFNVEKHISIPGTRVIRMIIRTIIRIRTRIRIKIRSIINIRIKK